MTRFCLVRHGHTDAVDHSLAGWQDRVALNARGVRALEKLAAWFAEREISAVYTSPIARTLHSAELIARRLGLTPVPCAALGELQFGDWTGKKFTELRSDRQWQRFNRFRSATRMPNGETMLETQTRAIGALLSLRDRHPEQSIALITHGDVIKAIAVYFLGMPLDLYARLVIAPASLTELELDGDQVRCLVLNRTLSSFEQRALTQQLP